MSARLLVVEDNQENLDLMVYLFQAFGYRCLVARDGEEGLATARSEKPDLIVCDIQIPKLDGWEVVRELKQDVRLRGTPLIAVTAYAMVGDRDRILAAGFDGYIAKPINPESFVGQVEAFLPPSLRAPGRPASPAGAPAAHAAARSERSLGTVLIVDNLPSKRFLIRSILEPSHYEILEAGGVDEALALARSNRPDLIVTDLHMPEKSGIDLVRELRADPRICGIPVLMHTATSSQGDEGQRLEPEDRVILLKSPVDPHELLSRIQQTLGIEEGYRGHDPGR